MQRACSTSWCYKQRSDDASWASTAWVCRDVWTFRISKLTWARSSYCSMRSHDIIHIIFSLLSRTHTDWCRWYKRCSRWFLALLCVAIRAVATFWRHRTSSASRTLGELKMSHTRRLPDFNLYANFTWKYFVGSPRRIFCMTSSACTKFTAQNSTTNSTWSL